MLRYPKDCYIYKIKNTYVNPYLRKQRENTSPQPIREICTIKGAKESQSKKVKVLSTIFLLWVIWLLFLFLLHYPKEMRRMWKCITRDKGYRWLFSVPVLSLVLNGSLPFYVFIRRTSKAIVKLSPFFLKICRYAYEAMSLSRIKCGGEAVSLTKET